MAGEKVVYNSVSQKEKIEDVPPPAINAPKGFGARHTQVLLLFISLSVAYSMRAHLSVSMVAMTSNATIQMWHPNVCLDEGDNTDDGNKKGTKDCEEFTEDMTNWSVYKVYPWHKATQEMILFSFFVGYTGMMIPMGIIAQKFGGKIPIMVALGANAVLSILTPWLPIFSGWIGVSICRLLQGMTQAAFYPSIHTILGKWAPLSERSRLASYIYSGSQMGTVLAFQVSGFFAGSPSLGWPATFWLCGIASFACFLLLWYFGAATPHEHPSISSEELEYIVGHNKADIDSQKRRTPWKYILTSPAVWGLVATHAGSAIGYLFILTQIPLYMNKILGVDIKKNGFYSSLPYVFMYITAISFGNLADWIMNKKYMSIVNIRRVSNSIGMVISSAFLLGFCYVSGTLEGVILLVLCLSSHSGIHVGFHVNSIDLAPNFAGPIMALGNMVANLASLINPVLVSNIVGDDVTNQHKWQILFWIMATIQVATNFVYVIFARGTVQHWNYYGEHKDNSYTNQIDDDLESYKLQEKKSVR